MTNNSNSANGWQIFRCQPAATLSIAQQLTHHHQQVYAPSATIHRRVPRTKKFEVKTISVMPSFLFIAGGIDCSLPITLQRKIRPMVINGQHAAACSWEIEEMRAHLGIHQWAKNNPPSSIKPLQIGDKAGICSGPLKGITGMVVAVNSQHITIDTNSSWGVMKLYPFLLRKIPFN